MVKAQWLVIRHMIVRLEEKPDVVKGFDDEKPENNSEKKSEDLVEKDKEQLEKEIVEEDKEVE